MAMINLDRDQERALAKFTRWYEDENKQQIFRLFGYAGTGKTTLATHIPRIVDGMVMFASFTGKAAMVLNQKLIAAQLPHRASTIHSLIYIPIKDEESEELHFMLNAKSALWDADLLIIDEVSMVSRHLARDLESFGTPILVIGDPAQLPPVKGMEHYIGQKPDVLLTRIHRQAHHNPILEIAQRVRRGLSMPGLGNYGAVDIIRHHDATPEILLSAGIRLVGKNQTRHLYNDKLRILLGFRGDIPNPGETVVCLRNNYDFHIPIFNGQLWTVLNAEKRAAEYKGWHYVVVEMEIHNDLDETVTVEVPVEFFYGLEAEVPEPVREHHQQFAFGYALTVHKSQGSEWDRVLLIDQPVGHYSRWRYTGITRAAKELIIIRR
jgi:exodeoxyribonuclease-5